MVQVRKVHREVTRSAAKSMARLYFSMGLDKAQSVDAPPRDLQRTFLRADVGGTASEAVWSAMEHFGLERIERASRTELPLICAELTAIVEEAMFMSAEKVLEDLKRHVFGASA